ncbi:ATP-dependent DNA helicase MER3 [Gnomoniopsis sp. IMI 355080]|nr:ATP-dependent DNA helicase MER3 [Gnomoniopsis sp. IMI 355080]
MDLAAAPLQRADQAPQQAPARRRYKRKPKPKNPAWAAFQTLRPNDRLLIDAAAKMIGVACSLVASKDGLSAKPHLIRYKSNLEQEGYLVAHAPTHTRGDGLGHLTTNGYSTFTAAKVQELFQTNGGYPDTSNSHWRRFSTQDLGIVDSPAPLMQETPASMFEQLPEPMFEQLPEPMLQQAPAPVFEHPLTPPLHHQNNPVDDANIANASATNRLNFNASPSDSTIYDYSAVDMEEWPSVTNAYSASYNDPYAAYANKAMGVPIPSGSPNASVPVSPESINPALLTLEPHQSQGIQAFGPGGPANGIELLKPEEKIPDKFLTVFPYSMFNAVQSKCFNSIYMTDDNMIVSAPTGSGKTVLLELAICKLASLKCNENAKIVYIAPTKALCREKAEQWRKKFAMMAMPVSELTGDTSYAAMRTVRDAKIIVTTPEKWDSITRGWVDHRKLLDLVELFLIDEVHILKESRGATLEAIVSRMKTYGSKTRYEDLGSGRQVIESTLHKNLIEHLNSEISLGTFQDIKGARLWMKGTFLSFRLQKNPRFYSDLAGGTANLDAQNLGTFDDQLEQICETAITNLKEVCLVKGDATFQHTDYGRAMSKYMIRFETMKLILGIPRGAKVPDLLSALCDAHEFHGIRWQANEKELFRNINRDPFIVHPINGTVSAVAHKISLLIQMELGRVQVANINGFERQRLRAETSRVLDLMHRLIRTVIECKGSDTDGQACWAALELSRSMAARAWEDKAMQLLQVPQLGPALMRKLVSHNIRTVSQLADSDPGDIERIASRNPPFGQRMVDSVMSFPRLTIGMTVKDSKVNLDGSPVIHVDGLLGFTNVRGKWQGKMPIVTFLAVATEGTSSYFCRKSLKAFDQPRNTHQIHFTWTPKSFGEALICRFACEAIVGTFVSTELHHNLPASAFKRRIRSSQFPSAKGHGSVLPQLPTGCPPIETKIDEDNILGIQGNIRSEAESSELGELEAHTRDDEPLAMFDRNCTITSPLDSTLSLEVTQKRAAEPFTDQGHWQLGNPGPSSHAVQQKADIDIRKHLPRSRKSRSPGDLPQTSDGEATEGEPVRLANGRYRCGHPCSQVGGGTTVRGDKCGHDCCRNGSKHPPRKKNSSGKRKVHSGDEAKSSTESIPDLTLFEPSLKRARKNDASKSTARAGVSPAFSPTNQTQLLQRRTTLDLELCDVDEEGIIDLTCDYETASDAPRRAVAPSIDKNGAITSANKTPKTIENLLGDLSDDDFIDIDSASESTHMGRRTQISHKLSNSADYLKETTSSTLLNEVQYKGMHSARNKSPQMASEESNVSRERIVDVTERGKSGSRCSQMTDESMFELPAPLSKPMGEKASNDDGGPDKQFSIKRAKQRMARLRSSLMSGAASSGSASFAIPQDERPVQNELVATQTKEAIEPQWEPQWVNEFDPALICEFRGLVDFI